MGSLLSYSGITTKIKAMQSKLIDEAGYLELSTLTSIPQAVAFLKKQPGYSSIFSSYDETELHRGGIEKLLTCSVYEDFAKLYQFANVRQRKLLDLHFKRFETAILKTCFREVFNKKSSFLDLSQFKPFFDRYSTFDLTLLTSSGTMNEIIENLKGTEYYVPLHKLLDIPHPTLFDYELCLDMYYFSNLWKKKDKYLNGTDLQVITRSYGSKIDMLNIQWIYRSKKYYQLTNADIYALILPVRYKLKKQHIMRLVECQNMEEFTSVLKTTYYAKKYPDISAVTLEDMYIEILDKIHKSDRRKYPYSAAIMNSYFYAKEHELDKLTTALECIRYGLGSNAIINYAKL